MADAASHAATQHQALTALGEHVAKLLGADQLESVLAHHELTIRVPAGRILDVLKVLRDDSGCKFSMLVDLTAVDFPERKQRFDVVYHLLSLKKNIRIRVKCATDEETPVASAVGLFPSAEWAEREVWDMFGIMFSDHPDLRRMLSDYGFEGHPLRKDFPLTGYVEVRYDDEQKRIVYEPVKLAQEFRRFDFMSPWEGAHYVLPGDEKAQPAAAPATAAPADKK